MIEKPEVKLVIPNWKAPKNVHAFFTLRSGGMSAGPYGDKDGFCGLNLGDHVGDNKYSVRGNRQIVEGMLGADPRWLKQVHSTRVVPAEENENGEEADAEFTQKSNTPCVVMTADCVPVLFCDTEGQVIAAAHAGWKGLANGILQNTVRAMRSAVGEKSEIMAWIGPHIRKDHFEVRSDVVEYYLSSAIKDACSEGLEKTSPEAWHMDLSRFVREALRQVGVKEIYDCGLDTFSDPLSFYSYRREKVTGRHGAFICKQ